MTRLHFLPAGVRRRSRPASQRRRLKANWSWVRSGSKPHLSRHQQRVVTSQDPRDEAHPKRTFEGRLPGNRIRATLLRALASWEFKHRLQLRANMIFKVKGPCLVNFLNFTFSPLLLFNYSQVNQHKQTFLINLLFYIYFIMFLPTSLLFFTFFDSFIRASSRQRQQRDANSYLSIYLGFRSFCR